MLDNNRGIEMRKLAIVCGSLTRGGAERVALYLAKFIKQQGVEVFVVTASKRENEYDVPEDITRICLNDKGTNIGSIFQSIFRLNSVIKRNNIDTVLVMGVPICVYAIPGCLGTKAKIVVSERNDPSNFAGKKITKYLSRFLMKRADGYVFQTNDAKKFYSKGLHNKGVIIPNPLLVDNLPDRFRGKRRKIIVTAGRLIAQKNQKILIDAFSCIVDEFPDYKLVIYGEGNLEDWLKNYVNSLLLTEKVEFLGNVNDLHSQIQDASLFVLSSNFEGMPNALIEAMALGLPCISTDCPCGGPKDLIVDGVNGVLVPVNDIDSMYIAIRNILLNDKFANELGRNAQDIKNKLSIERIGYKWFEYLSNLSKVT